jgi:hypothetical protein
MIANGAVAKIVLAVALGGSAGAISYVSLQHASGDQAPVTTTAPAAPGLLALDAPRPADAAVTQRAAEPVAKAAPRAQGNRARTAVADSKCTLKAKRHSKASERCRLQLAANLRNHHAKVLGYTQAMAVEPRPAQPVEVKHVDGPLAPQNPDFFKPVTDVMP